jgi:hypothetical protein
VADRKALADAQRALLAAVVEGGPAPEGFDLAALAELTSSLANKRSRTAAQVWPRLAHCLGARFATMFQEHVAPQPLRHLHGPLVDGWRLADASERMGLLDVAAADELAVVRATFHLDDEGATRRRGPLQFAAASAGARTSRACVVAGRLFVFRR